MLILNQLRDRLVVGHQTLDLGAVVRPHLPQPIQDVGRTSLAFEEVSDFLNFSGTVYSIVIVDSLKVIFLINDLIKLFYSKKLPLFSKR